MTRPIKKRIGWRQFSLRAMMILMLVSAVGGWWLADKARQSRAVDRLNEIGIRVRFADTAELAYATKLPATGAANPQPFAYKWIRKILGDNALRKAVALQVNKQIDLDVLLMNIQYFRELDTVLLNNTQADDQVLAAIAQSRNLETLYLGGSLITDAGVNRQLVKLTRLRQCVFWNTEIGDESAATFAQLPELDVLVLTNTKITDHGVAKLPTNLFELDLSGTAITDLSASTLQTMSRLERLGLRNTAITDSTVKTLAQMKNLRQLDLSGSPVTQQALDELRAALPECLVRKSARQ